MTQIMTAVFIILMITLLGRRGFRMMRGMMLRYLVIWGLIIFGVSAGIGIWQESTGQFSVARQSSTFADSANSGEITLRRHADGHYYADLEINDRKVLFLVDTGATDLVLTKEDAARIGLDQKDMMFNRTAHTANGQVQSAVVRLEEVEFGPFIDKNVTASVNGGAMKTSLLGMAYLKRFDSIQIADGKMILER